tara:strand:- start:7432 stop:8184 length:753 start_codon:yes stop_codon:yes gene_type:complete
MNKKILVLLRHGESQWNLENRFTGWTDIGLTDKGIQEARAAGLLIKRKNIEFDKIYTSVLKRAVDTMDICINEMGISDASKEYDWRLNERHYGSLQGLNKAETAAKYGDEQVHIWRRSYDIRPPALKLDDKRHPQFDQKYCELPKSALPSSECLKDTFERLVPLWKNSISPLIKLGRKILIVAHGNSLRALMKYLDKISDDEIVNLNIPTGVPILYELNEKLNPIRHYYLGNYKNIIKKTYEVANQTKLN